jgi:hypothetical protein
MNYAIINAEGIITNTIVWDGKNWQPPAGSTVIEIPDGTVAGIGWTRTDGEFIAPEPDLLSEPEPEPALTTEQKLEAAGLTVAELKELFGLN